MDPFDEFEMKPITPGLGFHKKPVSLKDHVAASNLVQDKIGRSLPLEAPPQNDGRPRSKEDILNEIKEALRPIQQKQSSQSQAQKTSSYTHSAPSAPRMTETLPRGPEDVRRAMGPEMNITPSTKTPMEIMNFEIPNASIREDAQTTGTRRGAHDAKIRDLVPVSFSVTSTILDAVIVLALSMIFMISLIFATEVNLNAVIASATRETSALLSLGVLYLAVWQMYVVVARSFFGATIGEWTFDLQLGEDDQLTDTLYPAKVLVRSLATIFTGFVVLPILSLVSNRDIAAKISGLQLYRKNT